ncbi:MAG: hypothetical protein A4E66_01313 [Syntrophus sp. PtaB.Bin001]|nr:MAG: hypothetical protein A4E66_01313 [Syntrophus sp. PtaB.Bin001]
MHASFRLVVKFDLSFDYTDVVEGKAYGTGRLSLGFGGLFAKAVDDILEIISVVRDAHKIHARFRQSDFAQYRSGEKDRCQLSVRVCLFEG